MKRLPLTPVERFPSGTRINLILILFLLTTFSSSHGLELPPPKFLVRFTGGFYNFHPAYDSDVPAEVKTIQVAESKPKIVHSSGFEEGDLVLKSVKDKKASTVIIEDEHYKLRKKKKVVKKPEHPKLPHSHSHHHHHHHHEHYHKVKKYRKVKLPKDYKKTLKHSQGKYMIPVYQKVGKKTAKKYPYKANSSKNKYSVHTKGHYSSKEYGKSKEHYSSNMFYWKHMEKILQYYVKVAEKQAKFYGKKYGYPVDKLFVSIEELVFKGDNIKIGFFSHPNSGKSSTSCSTIEAVQNLLCFSIGRIEFLTFFGFVIEKQ